MSPRTKFFVGGGIQKNIGLDKQNISVGIRLQMEFQQKKSIQLELFNTQYIRNLNVENYFNVYSSEYSKLKEVDNATPTHTLPSSNSPNVLQFMRNVINDTSFATTNPESIK